MANPLPSEEKLLHLDPHYCQPTVNMTLDDFDIKVNTPYTGLELCMYCKNTTSACQLPYLKCSSSDIPL